jgi:hypothetical protein
MEYLWVLNQIAGVSVLKLIICIKFKGMMVFQISPTGQGGTTSIAETNLSGPLLAENLLF